MEQKEDNKKEERIRAITHLYYSNPNVVQALLEFSKDRETVPRYFEGFGKRPDTLQYPSDVLGLVRKGATSFHTSEEIWANPLEIDSELTQREMNDLRKGWDLLIDIDSKYLDYSKKALMLIIKELENYGIQGYGIKFSGSKGFHLIIPWRAFPKEFMGEETKNMFPEWPRAIVEFIMAKIKINYNRAVSAEDISAIQKSTNLSEAEITVQLCPSCGRPSERGKRVTFKCDTCSTEISRNNPKLTKRRLKCIQDDCAGILEVTDTQEISFCEYCKISNISKVGANIGKNVVYSKFAKESDNYGGQFEKGLNENQMGGLDLVLVAPRHLFRMPYSLHEKTSFASIVLKKEEIENFDPKDADPLKVKIRSYYPECEEGEASKLLREAIEWKKMNSKEEEKIVNEKYKNMEWKPQEIDRTQLSETIYPKPIKKLLKGLKDGKKRGLFVLLTFLRGLDYSPEEINSKIREWNKLNETPLKEGYIKSQIDWHLKQRRKILPPNYSNESFYKDLGLIDEPVKEKNPLAEVMKNLRKKRK